MASPLSRRRGDPDVRDDVPPLTLDALYEVLLRLPAKDLCRLRAVCKPWRTLLSESSFIAAHSARHPEPLIVAGYSTPNPGGILCDMVDLSGRLVKRIHSTRYGIGKDMYVCNAQLDLIFIYRLKPGGESLFDPATGAVFAFPEGSSEENKELGAENYEHVVTFGKVASTGEYKVLRVFDNIDFEEGGDEQLCEVLTLGGRDPRWRAKKGSPDPVEMCWVTINGVVYFLNYDYPPYMDALVPQKRITFFDLETEEWGATFQGPELTFVANDLGLPNNHSMCNTLSLATLNDYLVVVHWIPDAFSMDLWFLMDIEKGLWVKKRKIQTDPSMGLPDEMCPLWILNDGKILIYGDNISIYDPRTRACTPLEGIMPFPQGAGLYTGSLLRLPNIAG